MSACATKASIAKGRRATFSSPTSRNVPYQSLIKVLIDQGVRRLERHERSATKNAGLTAKLTAKRTFNNARPRTSVESRSAQSNLRGRRHTSTDTPRRLRKPLLYPLSYEATAQRVRLAGSKATRAAVSYSEGLVEGPFRTNPGVERPGSREGRREPKDGCKNLKTVDHFKNRCPSRRPPEGRFSNPSAPR
jgi:hypothetical protein